MTLIPPSPVSKVNGIDPEQEASIRAFIHEVVTTWLTDHRGEWFIAHDLFGHPLSDWDDTPLVALLDKHKALGRSSEDGAQEASRDLGWLVKAVLEDDARTFQTVPNDPTRRYRLCESGTLTAD